MKTLETPISLRSPTTHYPWHQAMPSVEEYFYQWAQRQVVKTDLIYLPIFWWNNTNAQRTRQRTHDYLVVPEAQDFIDANVKPNQWYFTISQCDDGVYENLPENVIIFNAGGEGDVPIPLLSDPHPIVEQESKKHLASFVGAIECGGPVAPESKRVSSSWNIDGRGATLRRRMRDVFAQEEDCLIEGNRVRGLAVELERFRNVARASHFGLAPRGYGKTSFRLYEMFWLGAVPVCIYDDLWLPYLDVLDWEEFAVLCHESELESLAQRLRNIPVDIRIGMQKRGASLRARYFTYDGMCQEIARYLETF